MVMGFHVQILRQGRALLGSRKLINYQQQKWFRTVLLSELRTAEGNPSSVPSTPLLSEEYHCFQTWQGRLDTPIIKKIELDDFFYQVDRKYQPEKVISPIDVDLYVNKVTDEENLGEMEELVHRLRKSPSASDMLPSTGHAVIRTLTHLDRTNLLFQILDDRMNYGVFLDFYTANLLMDKFLTKGNYKDAAKVASLLMLEEDFGPPSTKFLAILSCLKYLEHPEQWEAQTNGAAEESKEEVKVRVKYLRNPFFDDHFDLTNPQHIVGKTLAYASMHVGEDENLRNSLELIGWALYDKWAKVERHLTEILKSGTSVPSSVLVKVKSLVDARLTEMEASPDKTLPKPQMRPAIGLNLEKTEVASAFARLKWDEETVFPLPAVKNLLNSKIPTTDVDLLSTVQKYAVKAITERTLAEIDEMSETYRLWEQVRIDELNKQMVRYKEIQLLLQHKEKKKELADREETIFFFDHEEEWMMKMEEKEAKARAAFTAETKSTVSSKSKKTKKDDDSDYVSPII